MIVTGMTKCIQKHTDFDFRQQKLENVDTIIFIYSLLQCLDFFSFAALIFQKMGNRVGRLPVLLNTISFNLFHIYL